MSGEGGAHGQVRRQFFRRCAVEIAILAFYTFAVGYIVGHGRGERSAEQRTAHVTELGRWLADAIAGVRQSHQFTGPGITIKNKGRAKLANGETYLVSVEMEHR